ncbi:MAG: hypothetical protein ACLTON_03665 [Christensenellales bacterium]|jgi:hypothetical protein
MVTMTMPPQTNESIVLDFNYYNKNMSIENSFIDNTTNTTKINDSNIIIDILNKILQNKDEYKTSSMNNNSIGENMKKTYYYTKQRIEILDSIYEFKCDFIYTIKLDGNVYIAENDLFNIFGYGETMAEAENQLYESVDDLWNVYVEESDENLDDGAINLKKEIVNKIRKIK